MIGKTIKDRYEIVAEIDEGDVCKALDKDLQKTVAIEVLPPSGSNQALKTGPRVEALVIAGLNHGSSLYDIFEEDENLFLVMELPEGETDEESPEGKEADPSPVLEEPGPSLASNAEPAAVHPHLEDTLPMGGVSSAAGKVNNPQRPQKHLFFGRFGHRTVFSAVILAVGLAAAGILLMHAHGYRNGVKHLAEHRGFFPGQGVNAPLQGAPKLVDLPPKPVPVIMGLFNNMCRKEGKNLKAKDTGNMSRIDRYYVEFSRKIPGKE